MLCPVTAINNVNCITLSISVQFGSKCRAYYTRRQINLYRMFFADFSVNSQPIFMKFCKDYFRVTRGDYSEIFIGKYCIA